MSSGTPVDFLLSSGFLAFGRQAGFLEGARDCGVYPDRLYGTSSGALIGSMYCAGWSFSKILEEVTAERPMARMALSWPPWQGVFHLERLVAHLEATLPRRFDDLDVPLAVGVQRTDGSFAFIRSGPLAPAVAASCAMPSVFHPVQVEVEGQLEWCRDGGAADRLGLECWRAERGGQANAVVHLVERTAGARNAMDFRGLTVVRSPRSGANFWTLGAVEERAQQTRRATLSALSALSGSNGDQSSRNR